MLTTNVRLAPPPVKPVDQKTEFAVGDTLLIDDNGKDVVVSVSRISVADHSHLNPKITKKCVLYTLEFAEVHKPFLSRSRIMTEKALLKVFKAHVWVVLQ